LFLPRSFLPLVLGGAPRNDEAVTAANDNMLHSRAAARDGMVAQLQFQMMHVVYEIRVTKSTKISAGHCREARWRCFDMGWCGAGLGSCFMLKSQEPKADAAPQTPAAARKCPTC
jgi:hypothetical protein